MPHPWKNAFQGYPGGKFSYPDDIRARIYMAEVLRLREAHDGRTVSYAAKLLKISVEHIANLKTC